MRARHYSLKRHFAAIADSEIVEFGKLTHYQFRVFVGNSDERGAALVAQLLIDDVHQRLARLESFELLDEELHGPIQPIGSVVGAMRGQQYIFQLVKVMAVGQRFVIENIQGGAFDTSVRKRT